MKKSEIIEVLKKHITLEYYTEFIHEEPHTRSKIVGFEEAASELSEPEKGYEKTMDIYASKGYKVTVTGRSINSGYPHDKVLANKFLKVGEIYTVEKTKVGGWHTDVWLQEVPDQFFNSVHFVPVESEPEKELKLNKTAEEILKDHFNPNHDIWVSTTSQTIIMIMEEFASQFQEQWTNDKVIDFVNWYLKIKRLPDRFELENQTIIDSFLRGDPPEKWHESEEQPINQTVAYNIGLQDYGQVRSAEINLKDELIKYTVWLTKDANEDSEPNKIWLDADCIDEYLSQYASQKSKDEEQPITDEMIEKMAGEYAKGFNDSAAYGAGFGFERGAKWALSLKAQKPNDELLNLYRTVLNKYRTLGNYMIESGTEDIESLCKQIYELEKNPKAQKAQLRDKDKEAQDGTAEKMLETSPVIKYDENGKWYPEKTVLRFMHDFARQSLLGFAQQFYADEETWKSNVENYLKGSETKG